MKGLILIRLGSVVLEKMLTHDDGRKPIAIGHLSDSGDLKTRIHTLIEIYTPCNAEEPCIVCDYIFDWLIHLRFRLSKEHLRNGMFLL